VSTADSVPGLLLEQAGARPDGVAIRSKRRGIWHAITWARLGERVARLAGGLQELGVRPGGAVGLVGENTPEWIVADLAIQALGASSAALPTQTPPDAIVRALADTGAAVVVCGDQEQVDLVIDAGGELPAVRAIVAISTTGIEHYDDPRLRHLAAVEAAGAPLDLAAPTAGLEAGARAVTMFSAGSTGDPRPAHHTAGGVIALAQAAAGWLDLGPRDRTLCVLSLATPAARVLDVYAAIAAGAEIAVPESPATIPTDLLESTPTVLTASPRSLALLRLGAERRARESSRFRRTAYAWGMRRLAARLDRRAGARTVAGARKRRGLAHLLVGRWVAAKLGVSRARRVVVTGGPVALRDQRFFWSLGVPVQATYGQAETGGLALAQDSLDDAGSAGRPLPGASARLEDGLLAVSTPAGGDTWHQSDDLAEGADGGAIRVRGRRTDVLRAGGVDVAAASVEAALCESEHIRRALVTGSGDGLHALVEVDPDATALWAADRELAFSTYGSMVALPEVRELVAAEVAAANDRLESGARIDDFTVLPRQLSVAEGELTALLTVRRERVAEHFAGHLPGAAAAPGTAAVRSAS
jgi:long-chain acyl-CoA synthetase